MQAILYAAKSTAYEHGSIPTQLDDERKLCERDGLVVQAEYQDEAKSAYNGLARAKEHAERIAAACGDCTLVVQYTDRLARGNAIHAVHLTEVVLWARKAGVTIRSVQDDSTSENLVLAVVMGERNHEDSKRKGAAVKAGLRRSAERGDWHGGRCRTATSSAHRSIAGRVGLIIDETTSPARTRRRTYICVNMKGKGGTWDAPPVDAEAVGAGVRNELASRFIDSRRWVEQQTAANRASREVIAAAQNDLNDRQRERDTAMTRYLAKQTDTREEALDGARERGAAAEARVTHAEATNKRHLLSRIPAAPSTLAGLPAGVRPSCLLL